MQHIEALRGKFKFHIVLVSARLFAQKIADGNESEEITGECEAEAPAARIDASVPRGCAVLCRG